VYLAGNGNDVMGPGTSTVQRIAWTPGQERELAGMGCACGGRCGGLGLFESGVDVSGWGWPEWAVVIFGGYALISVLFTTKRAVATVQRLPGERRKRKAAHYRKLASELTRKK
jgi:hypothetical protein